METIFNENFLLQNKTAINLYHQYAANLPIIDYHNHLPPAEIATNQQFDNLTQMWLKGDHYKWRAMRTLGVKEELITGTASDLDKFKAWAACVPHTLRNPLFHWTHLELKRPFGINQYLNADSAAEIYSQTQNQLQQAQFSVHGILNQFDVEMLCTTDDPCDDLAHHQQIASSNLSTTVLPGFRPDKVLAINDNTAFRTYIAQLAEVSKCEIRNFDELIAALAIRIDYFHSHGCRVADHGLQQMPQLKPFSAALAQEFTNYLANPTVTSFSEPETFAANVLLELSKIYHQKAWVQQFHLGAIRNNNSKTLAQLGADAGTDSIGDYSQVARLSQFLDKLESTDQLAKTIIYNLNPSLNEVFASMAGNFTGEGMRAKVQFGAAWWFLDQLDGMEKQLNALSNIGILSTFVGMLTDSRSFLSFPRHDYFRRLVCCILGREMENGLLPNDEKWIAELLTKICYQNAKDYFNLK
jgi:glucuronate isomerase